MKANLLFKTSSFPTPSPLYIHAINPKSKQVELVNSLSFTRHVIKCVHTSFHLNSDQSR